MAAVLTASGLLCCSACRASRDSLPPRDGLPAAATPNVETIDGAGFRHVVIRNAAAVSPGSAVAGPLHVYIEGDGRPGSRVGMPAADPDSGSALMLQLMKLDPVPSVYLGRPCYYGLARDGACNPHEWTDRRFSVEVVDSLQAALRAEMRRAAAGDVMLIGHSGGGALAVLLAARVAEVHAVVTLGANLDIVAWARMHGYAPLTGSLNPVEAGHLAQRVHAVHWVGSKDRVVPPGLVMRAAARIGGDVRIVPGYRHDCCWADIWPAPLAAVTP